MLKREKLKIQMRLLNGIARRLKISDRDWRIRRLRLRHHPPMSSLSGRGGCRPKRSDLDKAHIGIWLIDLQQIDESKAMKDLNNRIQQLTKLILTSQTIEETSESRPSSPVKVDFDMSPYQVS